MTQEQRKETVARPAATVMIVRQHEGEMEVFMVVRHHKIEFMGGALVFPGGKVDAQDGDAELIAHATGVDDMDDQQRITRIAAIREAFEECGVLLARHVGNTHLVSGQDLENLRQKYRNGIHAEEISMLDMVRNENLELACDKLVHFAHWIPPAHVPKRFDTMFFLAEAPAEPGADHDGHESVDSVWIKPSQALADGDAGQRLVVFPTRMNLTKLARSNSVGDALEAATEHNVVTVQPRVIDKPDGKYLCIPEEADYGLVEIRMDKLPGYPQVPAAK